MPAPRVPGPGDHADGAIGFAVDTTSGRIVGYYPYGAGYSLTNDDSDAPEYAVVAQPCQRP
jgi:hypothetical protein